MSEYTPITGELRNMPQRYDNFANVEKVVFDGEDFDRLCDTIDSIHATLEAENERLHGEWDFLESTHVELPKDEDEEYIHIGDVMEWSDGKTFEVVGIGDGTLFYVETDENGSSSIEWTSCNLKRHHYHAPTVESVLREFVREWWTAPREKDGNELLAEYAKRLTLAGEDE